MTTRTFTRRPRPAPPTLPEGEIAIEPPPELPRVAPPNIMMWVMPGAMALMVVGFIVVGGLNPASLMMGAMMLMMTVGMLGSNRSGNRGKAQLDADRSDYLAHLSRLRTEVAEVAATQREQALTSHPAPSTLWAFAGSRRMWERRQHDDDFAEVRLGRGALELLTPLRPPQSSPIGEVDPIAAVALRRFVTAHGEVADLPQVVQLPLLPVLSIGGDARTARGLARAIVGQLATFHGPDGVLIAASVGPQERDEWDWLKWLPHTLHPSERDGLGPVRMVTGSVAQIEEWLAPELAPRAPFNPEVGPQPGEPHLLIVLDGGAPPEEGSPLAGSGLAGVTVLDLSERLTYAAYRDRLDVVVRPDQLGVRRGDAIDWVGMPDRLGLHEAESLARRISPYRLAEGAAAAEAGVAGGVGSTDLEDMLGLGDLHHLNAEQVWRPRAGRDLLRVPIGVGTNGEIVELDLKESALGGMGPHGLVIGATGSGKSELLRTLVLGLVVTHSPEQLNLVLIDFKGGATFAGLHDLNHTAAVITNLADDLTLVDRMYDAISGELNRRQEALRDAGNLANVREYERARASRPEMPPLPYLFVVVDEFSELLTQKPDFAELFATIGRLGRSLGVHLLLASQRLDEGRLRGLDSHLSYRIGLKTFTAQESRTVLGVPDAYELPPIPGSGYLKADTGSLVRFKAAYVSGPYAVAAPEAPEPGRAEGSTARPVSFVSARVEIAEPETVPSEPAPAAPPPRAVQRSVLDTVVGRLERHGTPAHEVWLPPLDVPPTLDALLGPPVARPSGLLAPARGLVGALGAVVGIVDLPYEQRRDPLVLDLSGAAGNAAVVGGPQTGKSTALRTLVTSLALTHTPDEVQFYVVDLGGGSLSSVAGLPHVGGVVNRGRPDHLRRAVAEVAGLLRDRENRFRDLGVESVGAYRALRAAGDPRVAEDPFGDVFLLVDGWGALREDFEDLEGRVTTIAQRGLSYGIHVVVAAARWTEIRPALKDALVSRLELRLGDPFESEVDRRVAALVPVGRPGRGLAPNKRQLLLALPRIDGDGDPATLATAYADLVRQLGEAWTGRRAPGVRTLPDHLPLSAIQLPAGGRGVPIGIDEEAATVVVDFDADPHLLCFMGVTSGKSSFLEVVARGLMATRTSAEVRLLMVDYRRSLLGLVPPDYLAGYAASSSSLGPYVQDLGALLQQRLPGPDVTAEQLRSRSWWSGPEIFVLVDDHDLVAAGDNPLALLKDMVPHARDIGFHVVLARRSNGAQRALYDPLVQALRDSGAPGLVGSGPRDEGALVGAARPDPAFPAGRATYVRRDDMRLVQLAQPDDEGRAPVAE